MTRRRIKKKDDDCSNQGYARSMILNEYLGMRILRLMNTCDQILRIFETSSRIAKEVRTVGTRIAMERWFGIARSRGETETVRVERN